MSGSPAAGEEEEEEEEKEETVEQSLDSVPVYSFVLFISSCTHTLHK